MVDKYFFCSRSPWTLFEFAEMFILLERRTLLFHASGLIVGIAAVLINSGSRFPGSGFILGRRSRDEFEPWTRSWGYGRMPRPQSSATNHSANLGKILFLIYSNHLNAEHLNTGFI